VYSLGELAGRLDLAFSGDAQRSLNGLASLNRAGPTDLAFVADREHLPELAQTRAGAVILTAELAPLCPVDHLLSDSPYLMFARASALFAPSTQPPLGVHASATIAPGAVLAQEVCIGPGVVVEAGATIGAGVVLDAGVYVGRDCRLGVGTRIYPNAVLYHDVHVGDNCIIHSQAVLGADGFGFARGPGGWEKIHQLGGVRIGDCVEIGAGTTVDRGTLDHTVISEGVIIDNQVQIAHNCHIGKNTAIAGCVGLAGSTIIGANCTLAGGVGVVGHVEICDDVHVTGMTMVTRSITEPGSYSCGTPMAETREWKRSAVRFSQLEVIYQRLIALERGRS